MLSLSEFQSLIESGAVVNCTTKEECEKTIDFLEQLGFCINDVSRDISKCPWCLSVGLVRGTTGTEICRYNYQIVESSEEIKPIMGFPAVIEFNEIPFKESCSQQSDEDFYECFTRFLLS